MTTTDRSGITTVYRSQRFRSRLEARWAAFFDLIRWPWVYEPFDTGNWIPDFLIQGEAPFLVEVGPCVTVDQYREKRTKPMAAYPLTQKLVGQPGDQVRYDFREWWTVVVGVTPLLQTGMWRIPAVGIWGSTAAGMPDFDDVDPAFWYRCNQCGELCIDAAVLGTLTPNGAHYGPCGHPDPPGVAYRIDASEIEQLWRRAGNDVQWAVHGPERVGSIIARDLAR